MHRALYAAGWGYVALCGLVLATRGEPLADPPRPHPGSGAYGGGAGAWFAQVKPYCNAVEVEVRQQQLPAPSGVEGAGYSAACFALAGKIERARLVIDSLDPGQRSQAAGIVFNVGHPVADAGDDQSAGPIMRLVVSYQPDNYMALYHAGVSEFIIGERDYARTHLEKFLQLYSSPDYYRNKAIDVLHQMGESPKP